jgi:5-formaminoimidazole-4-carboxamide-1-beta-D-ribofuranosyl 5'-monophosphate synthetase
LLIRDFTRELRADNVVLELCDERYQDELSEVLSHPNYDRTMLQVHKFFDRKKPEILLKYDQIVINEGNFEMLVGLDTCSYRMPCKTIMGDRQYSISDKRYQAKKKLLNLYKEDMED